jgi:dTDP-4-dehydrorhamnose 3,5-epimerase
MRVINTDIEGVVIIEPEVFGDSRGYFMESFSERDFHKHVAPVKFVQDNESRSCYGVVRGLHYQREPYAQSKLVRCVVGRVLDVAVDIREESPTYGKHVAVELSAENHRQLFIPKGFAHGFAVLSQEAIFAYKCDEFYHPEAEAGIAWNDSTIGIDWRLPKENIILSDKDKGYKGL